MTRPIAAFFTFLTLQLALVGPAMAQLEVVEVSPAPRSLRAAPGAAITVRFDRPVNRDSFVPRRTFWAFGRWSGPVDGNIRFTGGDRQVELRHGRPFAAGEMVTVFLSHDLEAADGSRLRQAGYSFQFWVRAEPATLDFLEVERHTTRSSPSAGTRSYGGIATDLDGDGYPDITVVNEDSDDLRVFMNRGDDTGSFEPFLEPVFATGDMPSPSEPSDFDADGRPDIAVADFGGSISILLGRGDGRFRPRQLVPSAGVPRGIAVLDADGDGDVDVVHTHRDSRLSLVTNDGTGIFTAAGSFTGGGTVEWALGAADMNEDGILDLVSGDQGTERVYVYTGNGDGTFDLAGSSPSGGESWMLVLGDVDRDGHEDVSVVNGDSGTSAILLGDGNGGLSAPRLFQDGEFPLATDFGDLDGDGDLDWVTSSFFGPWRIYRNNGNGDFTLIDEIPSTTAASCALLVDVDVDGDLDLGLIDELADELIVLTNGNVEEEPEEENFELRVTKTGTGTGLITSDPAGIDCGETCTATFPAGTDVTLGAVADPGSLFGGWSGSGCSGRGGCTVRLNRQRDVTASFEEEIDCVSDDTTLCLNGGRFQVRVVWNDFEGGRGDAHRVDVASDDSGILWFFNADNWEMLVKVLDGCAVNNHFWVFAAATTNVGYRLRVFDTVTGAVSEYRNPLGTQAAAITDTGAFATCE